MGRQACLWGHPPPSPPSRAGIPQPLPPPDWGWWGDAFIPLLRAVLLGHCGQYYSRYAGGLFGTVDPAFHLSLTVTLPLPGFLSPLLSLLGISRAGLWIHIEGCANAPPCRAQDTVKGRAESTHWTLSPSEGGHWVVSRPQLLGQGQVNASN